MYKHILIATDGSELAEKGLEHGLTLAGPLDARVTVLTVTEPLHPEAIKAPLRVASRIPSASTISRSTTRWRGGSNG